MKILKKRTPTKIRKHAVHKARTVREKPVKKRPAEARKLSAIKKKTIGTLHEHDVKVKIHSKIREIDKKLDEVKIMVNGYRKIKDPHWGHFGDLARILSRLNEIC